MLLASPTFPPALLADTPGSQPTLKVYKPYELFIPARLELGMSLHPLVLLGSGMHCFPFTAASAGLLSVQESHRWKYHVFCMEWVVWGRDCTPQPSTSWHLCLNPPIRLNWITKSSFCIERPWHRWAMTLGHDPLMIEVNQHTRDEQWEIINSVFNAECQNSGFPSGFVLISLWPQENLMASQSLSFLTCNVVIRLTATFHCWWRTDLSGLGAHELKTPKTLSGKTCCWLLSLRPHGVKQGHMIYEYKICP